MLENSTLAVLLVLVFNIVTVMGELVVFTGVAGKVKLVGVTDTVIAWLCVVPRS